MAAVALGAVLLARDDAVDELDALAFCAVVLLAAGLRASWPAVASLCGVHHAFGDAEKWANVAVDRGACGAFGQLGRLDPPRPPHVAASGSENDDDDAAVAEAKSTGSSQQWPRY